MRPDIAALDIPWSRPTGERDGQRHWDVRCRVPFQGLDISGDIQVRAAGGGMPITVADGAGEASESGAPGKVVVEGVASSTGVDWYGTEMALEALESMADQMRAGVAYVPTHWDSEWMDELGRTVDAEVKQGRVENAAEPGEPQYRLHMRAELDPGMPLVQELVKRAKAGRPVGQSIGGYFTNLRFIEEYGDGGDDYKLRIVILGVELDHLAATRSPANRDCWIDSLRSVASPAIEARSAARLAQAAPPATPAAPMETRHVAMVEEDDDTIRVTFTKTRPPEPEEGAEADEDEEEVSADLAAPEPETRTEPEPDALREAPRLDTPTDTGHDTGSDARRGASDLPPEPPATPPTESTTMDDQKILDALTALTEEIRGLRTNPAKPESEQPNVEEIVQRAVQAALDKEPAQRRGAVEPEPDAGAQPLLHLYIDRARDIGAERLAAWFANDQRAERLTDTDTKDFERRKRLAAQDLRAFLSAALEDGVLNDSHSGFAW